jgi:hypothetical protein
MELNLVSKPHYLTPRTRLRSHESLKALTPDENFLGPLICLLLSPVTDTILIINKVFSSMQKDVGRLVKERPPKVIVGLHPQRHLNYRAIGIEPSRRAKKTGPANWWLQDKRDPCLAAECLHFWLEHLGLLSSKRPNSPNGVLEF